MMLTYQWPRGLLHSTAQLRCDRCPAHASSERDVRTSSWTDPTIATTGSSWSPWDLHRTSGCRLRGYARTTGRGGLTSPGPPHRNQQNLPNTQTKTTVILHTIRFPSPPASFPSTYKTRPFGRVTYKKVPNFYRDYPKPSPRKHFSSNLS